MRASTNILTILLTASMVAAAAAGPHEKHSSEAARTAAPARAAAPRAEAPRAEAPRAVRVSAPVEPRVVHYAAPARVAPERVSAPARHYAPERHYAAPRPVHVYAAPRPVHVYAAPRPVHVYAAPRETHVMAAPHQAHVMQAPRQARVMRAPHERAIVAPRQVHVMREPRRANAIIAPRRTRFALMPRAERMAPRESRFAVMPRTVRNARTVAPVESPLMLSREVRAVRMHGFRVSRVAVHPSRHVSYISGRVLGVNDRVVVIEPPAGGEVPVRIAYVPTYRTVVTGQTVTIPVLYTGQTYYAYQPNNVVPFVVNTLVPAAYTQYIPMTSPLYGMTMNPWDAQAYYNGFGGDNEGENDDYDGNNNNGYYNTASYNGYNNGYYQYYGRPQYPDCSQPYYGQNYNQYYFTHQQYDSYCGTAGDPYGYAYNDNSYDYGNHSAYPYAQTANYNPYYQVADTAIVSGLIVGRSGNNVIVLTNDLQPEVINVGPAEQMGNTSGPLQVGRPIVAAGFYDPTKTLVATTVQ